MNQFTNLDCVNYSSLWGDWAYRSWFFELRHLIYLFCGGVFISLVVRLVIRFVSLPQHDCLVLRLHWYECLLCKVWHLLLVASDRTRIMRFIHTCLAVRLLITRLILITLFNVRDARETWLSVHWLVHWLRGFKFQWLREQIPAILLVLRLVKIWKCACKFLILNSTFIS